MIGPGCERPIVARNGGYPGWIVLDSCLNEDDFPSLLRRLTGCTGELASALIMVAFASLRIDSLASQKTSQKTFRATVSGEETQNEKCDRQFV